MIVISPDEVSRVEAGSTNFLSCVAFGDPLPNITWSRDSTDLSSDTRITIHEEIVTENTVDFVKSTFQICGIKHSDSDKYSCNAFSGTIADVFYFNITVTTVNGMYSLIQYLEALFQSLMLAATVNLCY